MGIVVTILALVLMEGLLSFDNALVLSALVSHLPEERQGKALTYGILGAFFFRLLSLTCLTYIMSSVWVKLIGGIYLITLGLKHFLIQERADEVKPLDVGAFWKVVLTVELTDIMFSIDSIMASVALSQKFWIVLTGGLLGIVMMRFAAGMFISLTRRFPGFERTGYFLVLIVGAKLFASTAVDMEHGVYAYLFWGLFATAIATGFIDGEL